MTTKYTERKPGEVHATLEYLRARQAARAAGYPVSFTADPAWLLTMAINRRAGWPDDPTTTRGSAMPVNGKYPKSAAGDYGYRALGQFADRVNTPRLIVREHECPARYRGRLAHRLLRPEEE